MSTTFTPRTKTLAGREIDGTEGRDGDIVVWVPGTDDAATERARLAVEVERDHRLGQTYHPSLDL